MRKNNLLLLALMIWAGAAFAQKTRTVSGSITSNTTWYSDTIYTLQGYVFIKNNATLTIQPGTIIKGGADKATLIVTRNGRINAVGTQTQPIVMTSGQPAGSRQKGDWGGLVLLGKARTNRPTDCTACPGSAIAATEPGVQVALEGDIDNSEGDGLYGGLDDTHNAGTIKFVRIEFAGTVITPGNEINGFTMGGIGSGTTIENVQVSFADDDGFEWFGGTVNAKYLVSYRNVDDDLDVDFGFRGKIQFAVVVRDSNLYDIGSGPTTNGFESDNDSGTEAQPYTDPTFSNVTVLGPLANGTPLGYSNSFQNGARIRRVSSTSIHNSIFMGWPDGLFIDGARTGQKLQNDSMMYRNNILAGNIRNFNNSSSPDVSTVRSKVMAFGTDTFASASGILANPFNYTNPNFQPATGSAANSGASFSANRVSDPFFTPTTYRGAMGSDDWTKCWCNFDPNNANYNTAPLNLFATAYDAGNDTAICAGRNVTIGQNLGTGFTYSWTPAAGLNNTSAARPVASPTSTTKYFVTITDNATGCKKTDSITVTVNPNPVADFTSTLGSNGSVTFTNASTGAATYSWSFGNGNTSTTASPTHTYTSNGTFQVRLTATSAAGCTNQIIKQINVTGINSPVKSLSGDITTNTTLFRDTIYELNGYVFVKNNATLTIQSGTIIKGGADKATLVVTRNGKIEANGTKNQPIIMTSNKPVGSRQKGDWGGLVLLGKARTNRPSDCTACPGSAIAAAEPGIQVALEGDIDNSNGDGLYGGNDDTHNAGIVRYVRIEYAGTVITPGNEINGFTMGGIGSGTTIENVQVSFADDDGFEWFGGTVNAKYLISYHNVDDDLDVDFGFRGKIQYAIVQRDSNLYDIGSGPTTNGFESDNDSGTEAQPYTDPTFSNVTVLGPLANGTPLGYSNSFQNGARIRRVSSTSIHNSIFMGWPDGLFIDGARTGQKLQNDSMMYRNNILAGNIRNFNNSSSPDVSTVRSKVMAFGTDTFASANGILVNPFSYNNPNFQPAAGSAANSGASFAANRVSDPFFTPTTYRGALSNNPDSNWTNCWASFDPQNEVYTSAPYNKPGSLAGFSFTNPSGRTVNFTNTSSNALSYFWDFGVSGSNADTSVVANPTFVFPANGNYTVTLIARHPCGNSISTVTVSINDVSSNPVADFTFAQNNTIGSREFTFTNQTDEKGFVTTYLWDFGVSGSTADTSTAKNPVFTYAASGIYEVTLIAIGEFGTDTITKTVNAFPTAVKEVATSVKNIRLYPNPTANEVNLSFELSKSQSIAVTIFDIKGTLVKTIDLTTMQTGSNLITIPTEELGNGLYLVRMTGEDFNKTSRLVISK